MNEQQIIQKANLVREAIGGLIIGFPIEEQSPSSPYAVAVFLNGDCKLFPNLGDISDTAEAIFAIMEACEEEGIKINFDQHVRLITYVAQLKAPDVRMRRALKKDRKRGIRY
ncbi:hypothetical protein PA598K_06892 [Paenibacillus sp. 598K]|uniref:hypothetical protein n=1 Tax=Paenibacillus sp. 598K TaxID=1117987 RepID=UPI000FFA4AD0|nr:hypothetical protein [Paenibacillus sp. 598K]GBF78274.1 hypothetical protein PA598K_06892 [Paenibacillus sp. 598K]